MSGSLRTGRLTPLTGLILAQQRWKIPSGSMVGRDELVHGSQRSATPRWIINAAERFRKVTARIPGRWAAERAAPGHSLVLLTSEYFLRIDYESRVQALSQPPIVPLTLTFTVAPTGCSRDTHTCAWKMAPCSSDFVHVASSFYRPLMKSGSFPWIP